MVVKNRQVRDTIIDIMLVMYITSCDQDPVGSMEWSSNNILNQSPLPRLVDARKAVDG